MMTITENEAARTLRNRRVAFIGCGVMAEAMIAALLRGGQIEPTRLSGGEPVATRRDELAERYAISLDEHNADAVEGADLVMLTVKPQALEAAIRDLAGTLGPRQLVVSIVPGATIARLSAELGHAAVVRAMPNTPARIGRGITAWYAAPEVEAEARGLVATVLGTLGAEVEVEREEAIDMATALSGSGPAYVFLIMEALIDAGVHLGFARATAEQLVRETLLGAASFAVETGRHPAELRNMVTTPGGTTAAALHAMERGGLRATLADGVWAAYHRAQELGMH